MKVASKHILKAIVIEFLVAVLTFFIIAYILFNYLPLFCIIKYFGITVLIVLPIILVLGNWVGKSLDYTKIDSGVRVILGALFQFGFLTLGALLGIFLFYLFNERKFVSFNDLKDCILYFYIFGSIQTLIIGIWLGYKLSRIK